MPRSIDMDASAEEQLRRDYVQSLKTHRIRQITLLLFYFAGATFLCIIIALVLDNLK